VADELEALVPEEVGDIAFASVKKLSTQAMSLPRASNCSQRCGPRNPALPVTGMRLSRCMKQSACIHGSERPKSVGTHRCGSQTKPLFSRWRKRPGSRAPAPPGGRLAARQPLTDQVCGARARSGPHLRHSHMSRIASFRPKWVARELEIAAAPNLEYSAGPSSRWCRLSQPNTWPAPILINELHAVVLKRSADRVDSPFLQFFSSLKPRHCIS
jgi:hypothetical protein